MKFSFTVLFYRFLFTHGNTGLTKQNTSKLLLHWNQLRRYKIVEYWKSFVAEKYREIIMRDIERKSSKCGNALREWRVFAHFPIKYDPVTCQSWVAGCVFGWNNKGRTRHAGGLILCSHVPSLPKITLVSFASPFLSRFPQASPRIRIDTTICNYETAYSTNNVMSRDILLWAYVNLVGCDHVKLRHFID